MSFHSRASLGARHPVHNFEFADAAARTAFVAAPEDIGKLALQLDTGEFFIISSTGAGAMDSVTGIPTAADVGAATAAQGALADTALQPGDNISELANDAGLITAAGAPVQSVNGQVGAVTLPPPFSGDYNALSNLPTLGTAADNAEEDFATAAQGALADTAIQPAALQVAIQQYHDRTVQRFAGRVVGDASNGGNGANAFVDRFSVSRTFLHNEPYQLFVPLFWSTNSGANDILVELLVDGVLVADNQQRSEAQDVAGVDPDTGLGQNAGTDQKYPGLMVGLFTPPTAGGSHTITLRFAASSTNDLPTIHGCTLWVSRWGGLIP